MKNIKHVRKPLAILLAIVMLMGIIPMSAMAASVKFNDVKSNAW